MATLTRRGFLGLGVAAGAAAAGLTVVRGPAALADSVLAAEDTYVEKARPTATHGVDSVLVARGPGSMEKWVLVKFLPTTTSSAAQVRVKFAGVAPGSVTIMAAPSSAWSETTVNWNTRPLPPGAVLDTKTIPAAGQTVTFEVGSVTAGTLASFYIQSTNTSKDIKLYSRSVAEGPQLLTATPPTTTVAPTTTTLPAVSGDLYHDAYGWGS